MKAKFCGEREISAKHLGTLKKIFPVPLGYEDRKDLWGRKNVRKILADSIPLKSLLFF